MSNELLSSCSLYPQYPTLIRPTAKTAIIEVRIIIISSFLYRKYMFTDFLHLLPGPNPWRCCGVWIKVVDRFSSRIRTIYSIKYCPFGLIVVLKPSLPISNRYKCKWFKNFSRDCIRESITLHTIQNNGSYRNFPYIWLPSCFPINCISHYFDVILCKALWHINGCSFCFFWLLLLLWLLFILSVLISLLLFLLTLIILICL